MSKIFVFCNNQECDGRGNWHNIAALSEDGDFLAAHVCSNHEWVAHDMGFTSDWKRAAYKDAYPDGYELVYVEATDVPSHSGIQSAYQKYLAKNLESARTV